jgi:hypothetical protein
VQCSAGSNKKSSSPAYFQFDSSTVSGFLPFGASVAWLAFLNLPVGPVDTTDFCTREPPATTMSAGDWISLAIPPIAFANGAYARFADWIQQNAFSQYCQCVSATPTSAYATQILSLSPSWYYKLGESVNSGIIHDSSAHAVNGTESGTATVGQAALITGDTATSTLFHTNDAAVGSSVSVTQWRGNTGSASMEWWAKFSTPGSLQNIYDNYDGNAYVAVRVTTAGKVNLWARDSTGALLQSADSANVIADNSVHQFDLVLDYVAHTLRLYIDGATACLITGLTNNSYTSVTAGDFLMYDPHDSQVGLAGTAGHWSAYNYALSAAQVSDNRAAAGGSQPYVPPIYTPPSDGIPPLGSAPVCASYQDICNQLQITDYLLQGVSAQLSLFKARNQPSAWRTGVIRTGLTGTGVFTVLDILGLNVILTTVPATWGSTSETPRRLIPSAGSVQAGFASEYTDNWQLHYENEILMLRSTWATQVRYNIRPGITATIVELQPGD